MTKGTLKKDNFKKNKTKIVAESSMKTWQKDALSVLFIYLVVLFLFSDFVFQNKVFTVGGDVTAGKAITTAAKSLTDKEDQFPLWFPYMFSGMPSFASGMYGSNEDITPVRYIKYYDPMRYISMVVNILFLNRDHSWEIAIFFFAGVFMFLLARMLGFNQWIALCAAVAYMLNNFMVMSVSAGHGGKALTMAYIPLVLWSVIRFFRHRNLLNWSVMGFVFGSFFINPGHTQIVYYAFLMLGIYFLFTAVEEWKNNKFTIVKNGLGLGLAMAAGLGFGALGYFSQYVYSSVTMRAVPPAFSEAGEIAAGSGMTFDYITMWSFHPLESITFFIPSFFGLQSPYYWGWMTFTSSAFYIGLLPMIAAIIALIYRRNSMTLFLLSVALLALLISFGGFFEPFFRLALTVLPFFDKFRVPSMILTLFMFSFSLLACYGLDFLFGNKPEEESRRQKLQKNLLYLLIGAGVLLVITFLLRDNMVSLFSFTGEGDEKRYTLQQLEQLKRMRADILVKALIQFSLFLGIITAVMFFRLRGALTTALALPALVMVQTIDMLIINKPGLHPQPKGAVMSELKDNAAIRFIKNDPGLFRIFPAHEHIQQGSPLWTYHQLENIGGYSPTKMRIYQDLIDFSFYQGQDKNFPLNMKLIHMLNVKYILVNGYLPERADLKMVFTDPDAKLVVYENQQHLPRAFFVKKAEIIPDKKNVLHRLNATDFNPAETAILETEPASPVLPPTQAKAEITSWKTNRITVNAETDQPSLLVLSEVYYPYGWKAFINGQETPIYKTNYILRSVCVPAGKHQIEFRFEPAEFDLGRWVSFISFTLVTGMMIVLTGVQLYQKNKRAVFNPGPTTKKD